MQGPEQERVLNKVRVKKKERCRRSLLLSLFIASSIQQGGASEPGVQPVQAGWGLCEVGVRVGVRGGWGRWGWRVCDG